MNSQIKREHKKNNHILLDFIICMGISFAFLFVCSRSSWFYAFNNWDDVNSYFSMGKAIMNGSVPYRDLFDQKGIMLYMIYGLGYLISNKTFHGVFLIEVIFFTSFLMAFLKICRLYIPVPCKQAAGSRLSGRQEEDSTLSSRQEACNKYESGSRLRGRKVEDNRLSERQEEDSGLSGRQIKGNEGNFAGSNCQLANHLATIYYCLPYLLLPVISAAVLASRAFYWGGSAEELMLPFLMWGLYLSIRYFKEVYPAPMPYRTVFTGGILAGCILNIKFNSLGFFFGWIVMVLIAVISGSLEIRKKLKRFLLTGIIFLAGMVICTLPWPIYFAMNSAVYDWLYVYIYLNIFVYSEQLPLFMRIYEMCKTIYNHMWENFGFSIWIIWGIGYWVISAVYCYRHNIVSQQCNCILSGRRSTKDNLHGVSKRPSGSKDTNGFMISVRPVEVVNILVIISFTLLLIFFGGVDLPYYPLPICVFSVLGFVWLGKLCSYGLSVCNDGKRESSYKLAAAFCVIVAVLSMLYVDAVSANIPFHRIERKQLAVYEFRDYIDKEEIVNPSLLNVNCFDAGLYTTTGIVPGCFFYQTQTIHLDEVAEDQLEYIVSGKTDFIISRDAQPDGISHHYELVDTCSEKFSDTWEHTYYLYEKREQ